MRVFRAKSIIAYNVTQDSMSERRECCPFLASYKNVSLQEETVGGKNIWFLVD